MPLKEDCTLFFRLCIACQCRDSNLDEFFRYKNQPWPPALSQMNKLTGGQKADLVKHLEIINASATLRRCHIILDGAVAVQMIAPEAACTFGGYVDMVF